MQWGSIIIPEDTDNCIVDCSRTCFVIRTNDNEHFQRLCKSMSMKAQIHIQVTTHTITQSTSWQQKKKQHSYHFMQMHENKASISLTWNSFQWQGQKKREMQPGSNTLWPKETTWRQGHMQCITRALSAFINVLVQWKRMIWILK